MRNRLLAAIAVAAITTLALPSAANASHSWGGYHWARTANPFTLLLGDNVNSTWDTYLQTASSDWTQSSVLNTTVVAGKSNRNCKMTTGRVEVCNAAYGNNGWLGLASIQVTGGVHITKGSAKMNDTYFNQAQYNTPAWHRLVMCQEIAHTFGLDHQSETGASLNTCMDYYHNTSASDTKSTSPNQHDYDELATIYGHNDSFTTVGAALGKLPDAVPSFSPASRVSQSRYVDHLANGDLLVTWIIWAR